MTIARHIANIFSSGGTTLPNFSSTGIDDNADANAITINSSEQVGIGTGSGIDKELHVQASDGSAEIRIENSAHTVRLDLSALQDTTGLNTIGSHPIFFKIASSEKMRLTSTGLGIGTSAPNRLLTLGGTSNAKLALNASSYRNYTLGSDIYGFSIYDDTSTAYRLTVKSNGYVGIGETAPFANVHVKVSDSGVTSLNSAASGLFIESANSTGMTIGSGTTNVGRLVFTDNSNDLRGMVEYNHSNDAMRFYSGGAERMRIISSGNVGIGTSTPSANLEVRGASSNGQIYLGGSTTATYGQIYSDNDGTLIAAADAGDNAGGSSFRVSVDGSEAMRIDSGLSVFIGKTGLDIGTAGIQFESNGAAGFTRTASNVVYINRRSDDGTLVVFRQDNTTEGSITVSGSTVSYNGFTGTHWSRFTDNSTPTILKGTVLESLDEMCDWYNLEFDVITQDEDGNDVTTTKKIPHVLTDTQSVGDTVTYNHEGTDYQATIVKEADIKHMKSKVSDTVDAKNVYGVFVAYDEDGEGYNDFYVASVGSFVVRIKANETIAKGDLLQSNGDGTAKVQTDDAVRSSSFAKVLSTTIIETYEDGSYLVPCSLMC